MSVNEERANIVSALNTKLAMGVFNAPDTIAASPFWDGMDSAPHLEQIELGRSLFPTIRTIQTTVVPLSPLRDLFSNVEVFHSVVNDIAGFSISQRGERWQLARREILGRLQPAVQGLERAIVPALTYSLATGPDGAAPIKQVLAELASYRDSEQKRLAELKAELVATIATAKDEVRERTVASHARHFESEASDQDEAAGRWLAATTIAAIIVVATAIAHLVYLWRNPDTLTTGASIQLLGAKLILLTISLGAVVWCGRMYRALRHNAILNRHRARALSSLEAFAVAARDQDTKAAVLLHAAQSVFSPQASGFLGGDSEPGPGTQIVELYRSLAGGPGK